MCALATSTTKGQIYRTQKPDFSKRDFTQKFQEKVTIMVKLFTSIKNKVILSGYKWNTGRKRED
jgi:hypothetical protein